MKQSSEKNMAKQLVMKTPSIVSEGEWEAARQQLLVKEKSLTRARDALAAERRRMPWLAVPNTSEFEGASVLRAWGLWLARACLPRLFLRG